MRFRRRIKKSTKQYIIVAIICMIVIGGAATFTSLIIANQIREDYEVQLRKAYYDLEINKKNVFVATKDILPGEVIALDKVERRVEYSSQPSSTYITDNELGKIALVNISTGTQILNTMLTDYSVASNLREMEYNVIHISSNTMKNDTVDIRIFFPNGENYVVLAKKEIKGLLMDTAGVFLWLEEEDLLRMSAAIVDAALYQGAKLYVTKYIEPNIQEASYITYVPSLSILSLIENNPNIVEQCSQKLNKEVRKALENRLAVSMDIDITKIQWDTGLNNYGGTLSQEDSNQIAEGTESTSSEAYNQEPNNPLQKDLEPNASEVNNPASKYPEEKDLEPDTSEENASKHNGVVNKPTPTLIPHDEGYNEGSELGNTDFFYYAQDNTLEEVIEYGE